MGQRHKHADVIIAWAEGKDVQIWDDRAKRWWGVLTPSFYEDRKYRIKPPAKKYRVALFLDEAPQAVAANSQATADHFESRPNFARWLTDWIEYEE